MAELAEVEDWAQLLDHLERQAQGQDAPHKLRDIRAVAEKLGHLPANLHERARCILGAYHATIAGLDRACQNTADHLAMLESIPVHAESRSVYLDAVG